MHGCCSPNHWNLHLELNIPFSFWLLEWSSCHLFEPGMVGIQCTSSDRNNAASWSVRRCQRMWRILRCPWFLLWAAAWVEFRGPTGIAGQVSPCRPPSPVCPEDPNQYTLAAWGPLWPTFLPTFLGIAIASVSAEVKIQVPHFHTSTYHHQHHQFWEQAWPPSSWSSPAKSLTNTFNVVAAFLTDQSYGNICRLEGTYSCHSLGQKGCAAIVHQVFGGPGPLKLFMELLEIYFSAPYSFFPAIGHDLSLWVSQGRTWHATCSVQPMALAYSGLQQLLIPHLFPHLCMLTQAPTKTIVKC